MVAWRGVAFFFSGEATDKVACVPVNNALPMFMQVTKIKLWVVHTHTHTKDLKVGMGLVGKKKNESLNCFFFVCIYICVSECRCVLAVYWCGGEKITLVLAFHLVSEISCSPLYIQAAWLVNFWRTWFHLLSQMWPLELLIEAPVSGVVCVLGVWTQAFTAEFFVCMRQGIFSPAFLV